MLKQIRRVLILAGKHAWKIRLSYLFSFLQAGFAYAPYTLGIYAINFLYKREMEKKDLFVLFLLLVGFFVGQVLCHYICERLQSTAGYNMFADLRMKLGDRLKMLPMGFFTDGNIGKISTVLSVDMAFIESNCMNTIAAYVSNVCSQILIIGMMSVLHPYLGAVAFGVTLLFIAAGNAVMKKEQKEADNKQEINEELAEHVIEYIEGMGVIRAYNMMDGKEAELDGAFDKMKDECIALEKEVTPGLRIVECINIAGVFALVALGAWLYEKGNIPMFAALGICIFSFGIFKPVKEIYMEVTRFAVMKSSLNRIEELFNREILKENNEKRIPAQTALNVPEIEFKNVSFAYESEEVLQDVSFCADKNTMTALIGPSGGGKSTVANLLTRFWDIKKGSICIRGVDIRDVPLENLMDNISAVFQKVYLFKDSIYNNIRMGRPNASREEILECAKRARCDEFLKKLPYGIDTVIGEGGASLSGGEAQRVSIARCILKDSPIIILDEATSGVDADNESYIQEAIDELCKGKTLLVIAHRLNTIKNADAVYRVDNRKVTAI
ncbi:MAG: ABC transporter ATP-binding protein/permease [Lachnospiraceae bacterium]|nr:ABC transporter ATP-binding protein/permease [Lachnospiraceae bacterium]